MFLSTATVASYFGSPLLLALSEQMLKVFLFSCVPQSVVLLREQMVNRFSEQNTLFRSGCHPSGLSTGDPVFTYIVLYMGLFPSPNRAYGFGHKSFRLQLRVDASGCY